MCIIDANATQVNQETKESTTRRAMAKFAFSRIAQSFLGSAILVAGTLGVVAVIKNAQNNPTTTEEITEGGA